MLLRGLSTYSNTNRIAINTGDCVLTYKELYDRANAMAFYIKENYPSKRPLAIYGDKQADIIVCAFACVLARKTYVILPDIYPEKRLKYIINDCCADVIFNPDKKEFIANIPSFSSKDFDLIQGNYANRKELKFDDKNNVDDVALLIYTSGSTGYPKGVEITYKNLDKDILYYSREFAKIKNNATKEKSDKTDDLNKIVCTTSYGFSISLCFYYFLGEIGATWYPISSEIVKDAQNLLLRLEQIQPNSFLVTPSLIRKLLKKEELNANLLRKLSSIISGGEPFHKNLAVLLKKRFPSLVIYNGYGATETGGIGIGVTVDDEILRSSSTYIPAGYKDLTICMLMDKNGKEIKKDNEYGEIVFYGDNVSKGYHNNDELTDERFCYLDNGVKAFKTGDVGYYANNLIFLAGRKDNQVKIGGNRIELEDVEAHINDIDLVEQCAVGVKAEEDSGTNCLVALIQLKDEYKYKKKIENFLSIKKELINNVEGYKIPQKIVFVDRIPKNENGKIDRKKVNVLIKEEKHE